MSVTGPTTQLLLVVQVVRAASLVLLSVLSEPATVVTEAPDETNGS